MERRSTENEPFISKESCELGESRDCNKPSRNLKSLFNPAPITIAVIVTAITSCILTLLVQSAYFAFIEPITAQDKVTQAQGSTSLPKLNIPTLGTIPKIFQDDPIYLNRSTEEGRKASEKAWKSLIPTTPLPESLVSQDTTHKGQFAVSSFHQLHCLHMVVKSYFSALGSHDHDVVHTKHCLEYLRNSIVCSADSALEPWKKELNGVDGFGNVHMCRDFEGLFKWAEEFRATDV
ncbi:hypothetical protein AOL_s00188g115 [Orbilia oligospora ATCC 24927]|uniref:Oxidase ustYa n=1 Tax=Arthrobotrys oligospora (strain ATCC 24927 / CBS 115.81 / DSM 1491) TaxID=756982 RepID=G1XQA4_ARTOA|nr:hypothetical protein AOL_s00188g115 [Orbilia oligospora ATCC 24927]EGX44777.1 hypothetical protein AOL_s00188g115 [Orbilia oligospora ATCC 24927]